MAYPLHQEPYCLTTLTNLSETDCGKAGKGIHIQNRNKSAPPEDGAHIASWCWWLAFSESEHLITYHHPSATRAEVLAKYPRALVAEPYEPAAAPQAADFLPTVGNKEFLK